MANEPAVKSNGNVTTPRPYDRFRNYVSERTAEDKTDPAAVAASVGERILAAQTEDEIWDANEQGGTTRLDSLAGCELEFLPGWRFVKQTDPEMMNSLEAFIIGEAIIVASQNKDYSPGQQVTYNTGVERVIATLEAFRAQELLPKVALVHGTDLGSGKTAISLRRPAARAVSAK